MSLKTDASFAFLLELLVECAFSKVWEIQNELEMSWIHQIMVYGNHTNFMSENWDAKKKIKLPVLGGIGRSV
jgi:hypothetical protein